MIIKSEHVSAFRSDPAILERKVMKVCIPISPLFQSPGIITLSQTSWGCRDHNNIDVKGIYIAF